MTPRAPTAGSVERDDTRAAGYVDHVVENFGSDLTGCGSRSTARTAPTRGSRRPCSSGLGAGGDADRERSGRHDINVGCGADRPLAAALDRAGPAPTTSGAPSTWGRRPDARVDAAGEAVDGDQILAICAARARPPRLVVVTTMTNLGFHRLMDEHGIRS
jgi:hypothetical protein